MDITTKDIIKALPFEKEFKEKLLREFDTFPPQKKFDFEQAIWDLFDAFYDSKIQENYNLAMNKLGKNKEDLDKDFFNRVRAQTDKEIQDQLFKGTTDVELAGVRAKLENILKQKQVN